MTMVSKRGVRRQAREEAAVPPPPPRRRRWWLAVVLVVPIVLVWLLPGIVAHTPLWGWAVRAATGQLRGSVAVQSVSLGWLSPVAVSSVEVRDAKDQPVLQVGRATSEKSLLGILWNLSSLGKFRLEEPKLAVVLRNDGSNVENLLAGYLKPADKSKPVGFELEIVDGRVSVTDQETGQAWQIEKLQLEMSMSAAPTEPLRVEGSANIADAAQPGNLAFKLSLKPCEAKEAPAAEGRAESAAPAAGLGNTAGQLSLQSEAVPLGMFERLAARFLPGTRLAGRLSTKIDAQWDDQAAGTAGLQAEMTADRLAFGAAVLGDDQLRLDRLHAACTAKYENGRFDLRESSVDCDVGNIAASARLDDPQAQGLPDLLARQFRGVMSSGVLSGQPGGAASPSLLRQSCDLSGSLDLARLARMLPGTLRIRAGTQITSGQVRVALSSTPGTGADAAAWRARLETSSLTAVDQGRQIVWEVPIQLTLAAHETPQGPAIDSLLCESEFLKANAVGTPDNLAVSISFNLKQLADRLKQFVDLGGLAMAGDGWGQIHWTRTEQQQFGADADVQLRNFQLAFTNNWRMAGTCQLTAQATVAQDAVAVRQARLTAGQLVVAGPGLNISEPTAELTVAGRWDRQQQRWQVEKLILNSTTLAVQGDNVLLSTPDKGPWEMTGAVSYRGDLARLRSWFADGTKPSAWHIAGQLTGTAQLRQSAGQISANTVADIANLSVASGPDEQFQERQVHFVAQGNYQPQSGVLRLDQCELTSGIAGAKAAGQIVQSQSPAGSSEAELSGQLSYDWEKFCVLLRPYLGKGVRVTGRGSSPAWFRGPLSLAKGQAATGLQWNAANLYGFQLGPGELKAALADGFLKVEPLNVACNQGRLLLAPRLRLAPDPMELTAPAGPVVQNVQISPAMCEAGLKYIAPVLAEVATAQGAFSIDLDGCRIPLSDPAKGEMAGRFIVHSVEIGPGPMIRELATFLSRGGAAKLKRESVVSFRMVGGRVYHEGLELEFPDLTIRTRGSVGLDQSLKLMAEMSIPPKWLDNTPIGAALQNKTIQLPIGGTLSRPQLDRQEMARQNRQILGGAVRGVLESGVGKQLERLLAPPR